LNIIDFKRMKVNEKEKIFHKHIKKHKRRKKIVKKGVVALSGSLFEKKNKSRALQSPALGVRFKYEQKQNLTERLYLIFSVLSNQTSTGS